MENIYKHAKNIYKLAKNIQHSQCLVPGAMLRSTFCALALMSPITSSCTTVVSCALNGAQYVEFVSTCKNICQILQKKIFLLLAWLTWPCWSPLGEKNCSVPGRREGMNCSTALPTEFRVVVGSSSL